MRGPLVTVAISTYNRAAGYFLEAYRSALAQEYVPLEIVVCDNASTDATGDVVAADGDERVRYIRQEHNIGPNGNFNACLEHARGRWFVLLHDDDRLDADFVSTCMAALAASNGPEPGMIRTGVRVMDAAGRVTSERENRAADGDMPDLMLSWFERRTSMYFCNTLYRTDALREAGGFHTPRELYIDVAANVRIAARYGTLQVPDVKASFRRHGGNNGNAQSIEAWCEDSRYLVELMCDLAPDRRDELEAAGMRFFTVNNYSRVARFRGWRNRLQAYWTVYRAFGFSSSPVRYVAYRAYRRSRGRAGGSAV